MTVELGNLSRDKIYLEVLHHEKQSVQSINER
jgi:hypothetical protein